MMRITYKNIHDFAVIYHIFINIRKYKKELDYEDFRYILGEYIYKMHKDYDIIAMESDVYKYFAFILDETSSLKNALGYFFTRINFGKIKYMITPLAHKNKKILKYDTLLNNEFVDYHYHLSEADIETLDKIILKWKIYARFFIQFDIQSYIIKRKLQSNIGELNVKKFLKKLWVSFRKRIHPRRHDVG